ncbi:MAG: ABC transporter ATP-binding protein [Bacteroidetes bacterium]|nr:ABC transporter ATP-binding protein [Bacteroidota bacterium]
MIEIENIDFSYRKGRNLFKSLSLVMQPGHIYGLLGKNGAGKSTLLKNIAGLVFPQKGKCYINGKDSSKRFLSVLQQLYFIPEEIFAPALTSEQFVSSTSYFYPEFNTDDFYKYIKILDVDPSAIMSSMSFGQQKKAIIAFGLATHCKILILDEPTNGLDIPSKIQFRKLIASVLQEDQCIIISTHQVRDLDSLIDYLLILDDQKIVVQNSIDELTEKLEFGVFEDTSTMEVLYEEKTVAGSHAILKNTKNKFSKIDLELFFNGVVEGNRELINALKS